MNNIDPSKPVRILLVDGDADVRRSLLQGLEGLGAKVFQARDEEEGFDIFCDVRPDVVVSDVILPAGSGLDLCAKIRDAGTVPVILTSAVVKTREQQVQAREKYGASAFLVKPMNASAVFTEVQSVLAGGSGGAANAPAMWRPEALELPEGGIEGGELGPFTYPLLLMAIFRARETGVLSLERELANRTIYFLRGVPVYVASANRQENLGRLLVEKGRITEEDHKRATQRMQEKGIRQGEALVDMGLLTYQELYAALQEQAREKLVQGFGWDSGAYSFVRTEAFLDKLTLLELDSHAAIAEGAKRFYPLEKLAPLYELFQTAHPEVNEHFVRYFDRLNLSEEDRRFAASMRGHDAFRDIAGRSNVDLRDFFRVLTILLLCDMVALRPHATQSSPGTVHMVKGATDEVVPPNEEDEKMREIILENYLRVDSFNYFQVLGVAPSDSDEKIRDQYEKLSVKYHPENYERFNLGPVAAKLEEIYLKVELAYRTLSSAANRREYESFLERSKEIVLSDLSATLGAEMEFGRGQELLEAGDFDGAIDALKVAVEQNPLEPDYHTLYGVALFRSDTSRSLEARSHINRALAIDPNNAAALGELGRIYSFEGKTALAKRHFQAALRVKPHDESLQRDLAHIEALEKAASPA